MKDKDAETLIKEMEAVKKLLIMQLLVGGARQKDVAQMLGVSEATMSRMLPKGMEIMKTRSKS